MSDNTNNNNSNDSSSTTRLTSSPISRSSSNSGRVTRIFSNTPPAAFPTCAGIDGQTDDDANIAFGAPLPVDVNAMYEDTSTTVTRTLSNSSSSGGIARQKALQQQTSVEYSLVDCLGVTSLVGYHEETNLTNYLCKITYELDPELSDGIANNKVGPKKRTRLHYCAAFHNRNERLKHLLRSGGKVNVGDTEGCPPIYYAAKIDNAAAATLLCNTLQPGNTAQLMMKNKNFSGFASLHIAAENGNVAVTNAILDSKACTKEVVELHNVHEEPAIIRAGLRGYPGVIRALISKGKCDVSVRNIHGWSAGVAAADNNYLVSIMELAKSPHFDVNIKTTPGDTMLIRAALKGHTETVRYLLTFPNIDIDYQNENGWNAALAASDNGFLEVVRELYNAGANFELLSNDRENVLTRASLKKHTDIVRFLLECNVNVNVSNVHGYTPLLAATDSDSLEIVKLLCEGGCDVNMLSTNREHALIRACVKKNIAMIRLLLVDFKSDPTVSNVNGWSALICCSDYNLAEGVDLLVADPRTNINSLTRDGEHGLLRAALRGYTPIVEALLKAGADPNVRNIHGWTSLHAAADAGHTASVRMLLKYNADVNILSNDNEVPLTRCALKGYDDICKLLVEASSDCNNQNINNWTPLIAAADRGHYNCVKTMLEKGDNVNINLTSNEGETALVRVLKSKGTIDMVQLLVQHGSNVNIETNNHRTALSYARENGNSAVINYLRNHGARE